MPAQFSTSSLSADAYLKALTSRQDLPPATHVLGQVVIYGQVTDVRSTGLAGPLHWDPSSELITTYPLAPAFTSFFFSGIAIAGTPFLPIALTDKIVSLRDPDSLDIFPACDGWRLIIANHRESYEPEVLTGLEPPDFIEGQSVTLNFYHGSGLSRPLRKAKFQVTFTLRGSPVTVWVFGAESFQNRDILRPFYSDDKFTFSMTPFRHVAVQALPVILRHGPVKGSLRHFLTTLKPVPHELLAMGSDAILNQQYSANGPPLLEQLTKRWSQ